MGIGRTIERKEKEIDHVIQSEAKDLVHIHVNVSEIFLTESSTTRLPPFGRLNDN